MGKKVNIFQIDAFTDKPFQGNPAGVTFADGLTPEVMQLIAKEMNLAETAFLGKSDRADYHLRWFTPAVEVELCGHATIASLHFLNENNLLKEGQEITFDTRSGILKCRFEMGKYFMQIPIYSIKEFNEGKEEILNSLGIEKKDIDEKVPFLLAENADLYINIKSLKTLHELKPNYKELNKLNSKGKECVAVYTLETVDKESFAHSRFFAPYYGIDEDPVTGSMNGPLIQVLIKAGFIKDEGKELNFTFEQGDVLGRRGRVGVRYSSAKKELYISGNAVTMLKGEMTF
jgi:trans-2,3-dihydro-3-hydroxyanthranilate isomerase